MFKEDENWCEAQEEEQNFVYNINEQFNKTDIEQFASVFNDLLVERFGLETDKIQIGIEGQTSYLEIKLFDPDENTSAYIQIPYYTLCYYGNRDNLDKLTEKIVDTVLQMPDIYTQEDLQTQIDMIL